MADQFGQLIEPSQANFSFGVLGWYVLGALNFLLLFVVACLWVRHYRKNRYRRRALNWLAAREAYCIRRQAYPELVNESNILIKRIAMRKYGRAAVAGKKSSEWIAYINGTWREGSFDKNDEQLLSKGLYASGEGVSAEQARSFINKTRRWINNHF
jgi:Domain of unknown function (DUF4381)